MRKRKKMAPEERAEFNAQMARLEARERQLRRLVEAGEADMKRRAAEGRPYRCRRVTHPDRTAFSAGGRRAG